jgi:hypothetical protein
VGTATGVANEAVKRPVTPTPWRRRAMHAVRSLWCRIYRHDSVPWATAYAQRTPPFMGKYGPHGHETENAEDHFERAMRDAEVHDFVLPDPAMKAGDTVVIHEVTTDGTRTGRTLRFEILSATTGKPRYGRLRRMAD